ncbi:PRC-barrel domain-containing protein [Rhizomicrobium electricum]|uniref:PRC-barrel domain-containing protein n=1 Tax=Rhizomicrobium electricum TaxID=480070 RepID=A0ABP3PR95_9PROT|nr:PRC-barrel domain-containing protein [Rhizomicrobium electricum]NIJ47061.1 sporulation protein YlmC with PRC-barrel domain [Rhizomicrobium electricum]
MKTAIFALLLGACCTAPLWAQTTSPPPSPMNQGPASNQSTMPSNTPMHGDSMMSHSNPTSANLTGQAIYNTKGKKIGTVAAMTTDTQGQQAVSVTMEKHLGMGAETVAIPVSSLEARQSGGYTTRLSSSELKSLAKSGATHTP